MVPPLLHFRLVPAHEIPNGLAVSVQTAEADIWLLAEDQIDEALVEPLLRAARSCQQRCTLRAVPRDEPWGQMFLVREDIPLDAMDDAWKITASGIYIPVPQDMITSSLAEAMAEMGTGYLRYIDPVDISLPD